MNRPDRSEYPEYYENYVGKILGTDLISELEKANKATNALLNEVSNDKGTFAYTEGKWTLNELLQHMIDVERIFAYRMLRIARADKTPLPGFEQDDYVPECNISERSLSDLINELNVLRQSTLIMVKSFSEDMLKRKGTASEWEMSVRGIGYTIAGHEIHHQQVIKDRYLN